MPTDARFIEIENISKSQNENQRKKQTNKQKKTLFNTMVMVMEMPFIMTTFSLTDINEI